MSHTITGYYHKKMGAALQLAISDAHKGCVHPKHRHSLCNVGTLQPLQPMLRTQTHPTTCKGYQYNDRVIVHCHDKMQAHHHQPQPSLYVSMLQDSKHTRAHRLDHSSQI